MDQTQPDPDRSWQPATFAERGVAIPFTSPLLEGARARRGPRGLELVVPQPSGARGVYILAWGAIGEYCTPTLHDQRLGERIAAGVALTPPAIRQAARLVAKEGLAGRRARAAASLALDEGRDLRLRMNALLTEKLVAQMKEEPDDPSDLGLRAKFCIRRLAASQRRPAETLLDDLDSLAGLLVDHRVVAVRDRPGEVTCTHLAGNLRDLAASLRGRGGMGTGTEAEAVAAATERSRAMAIEAVESATRPLADIAGLLASWGSSRGALAASIARADWLLDGWQLPPLIWRLAEDEAAQRAALAELAFLVPVLPREACGWPGDRGDDSDHARALRNLATKMPGCAGAASLDRVARNEHLRALAA